MKSYKLNKTLENSTYPIEQELKKINKSVQGTVFKAILSITTVIFSGIATSIICENKFFICAIIQWLNDKNIYISNEYLVIYEIITIYLICIFIIVFIYIVKTKKKQIQNMKKSNKGRLVLCEKFHKLIINEIVVGLSFVDKSDEVILAKQDKTKFKKQQEVKKMYLYEAIYYFMQASNKIGDMKLYDDKKDLINMKLIEQIGRNTLLTTLIVFYNGLQDVKNQIIYLYDDSESQNLGEEYTELKRIMKELQILINILKN